MPTISLTLPVAGTTVTAGLHSANYSALQTLLNGGLDTSNWAAGKIFAPSKLMQEGATDGQVLKWVNAASQWQPAASASSSLVGIQILTGAGTYTPTSGTTRIFVELVGGGGAGGGAPLSVSARGGGGGAGAYAASLLTSGFSGAAYSVGAAGVGASNAIGGAGGDSTWATTVVVAKGGAGGPVGVASTNVAGGAGGTAAASTGTIKEDGQDGQMSTIAGGSISGGDGGNSVRGVGGRGLLPAGTGNPGKSFGGGGGGAYESASVSARIGGAGGIGTIIVSEFA